MWTSPLIPQDPFVYRSTLCPELKQKIAQTFLDLAPRVLVVGCEPATVDLDEQGQIGLSPAVEAAVDEAVRMVESLVIDLEGSSA